MTCDDDPRWENTISKSQRGRPKFRCERFITSLTRLDLSRLMMDISTVGCGHINQQAQPWGNTKQHT
jgi:hypothetical protein